MALPSGVVKLTVREVSYLDRRKDFTRVDLDNGFGF